MFSQSQIKRTLSHPDAISYVAELLDGGEFIHRSGWAEFLCEEWGFQDACGDLQCSGCVKALRALETAGHFRLPLALAKTGPGTPKRLAEAVADPTGVPAQAGEVRGLVLILVLNCITSYMYCLAFRKIQTESRHALLWNPPSPAWRFHKSEALGIGLNYLALFGIRR